MPLKDLRAWLFSHEFFNPLTLAALLFFVLNNLYWKGEYHNWFTGKLSDVTFCFFFPLYVSALLHCGVTWSRRQRLQFSIALTCVVFAAVKCSATASDWLNSGLAPLADWIWQRSSINYVDHSDLLALPFSFLCWFWKDEFQHERE